MTRATPVVNIGLSINSQAWPQAVLCYVARPAARPGRIGRKRMHDHAPAPDGTTGRSSVGEGSGDGGDGSRSTQARTATASTGHVGDKPIGGTLRADVARAVVRIHGDRVGRGPTKAHAFFHGSVVVVVLEDILVNAERTRLASGHDNSVIRLRQELLTTMQPDTSPKSGIGAHVFVLDQPIQTWPIGSPAARESAGRGV